jgi:hypothetical protein
VLYSREEYMLLSLISAEYQEEDNFKIKSKNKLEKIEAINNKDDLEEFLFKKQISKEQLKLF